MLFRFALINRFQWSAVEKKEKGVGMGRKEADSFKRL